MLPCRAVALTEAGETWLSTFKARGVFIKVQPFPQWRQANLNLLFMSVELHPLSWYRDEFLSYLQSITESKAHPLGHDLIF